MNTQSKSIKTTCPYCGVGCGITASCNSAGVSQLKGDVNHPANKGRLCVKGSSVGQTLVDDGRLLQPLYQGKPIGWDKALQQVADKFQRTIKDHGADSVAFYLSGQLLTEDYYVANKLMKGFIGSANIDTNSRLCMASAVAGYKRAFGSDTVPCNYEDLEQTDLLILVGANPAWAHPILFQRIKAAKADNPAMKVVVIDPRRTESCDIADLHLAITPGSDSHLFNGLLAWLVGRNAIDTDYIQQYVDGFDQALAAAMQCADLTALAAMCGVSEAQLTEFFRCYETTKKVVSFYSMGVNQSASGVDNSNAIINCHLATGRIGKPGMGPFSITGQPNAMGGREVGGLANQLAAHMDFSASHLDIVSRFWQAPNMVTAQGLKAVDMFQAVETGQIKAIWIMGTNPVVSMPNADQVKRALTRCPLVVVSDCVASTDTSAYADYLLPATGWGEKNGTVTNSERRISRQRGLFEPKGQAKHDWQVLTEFAGYMGYGDAFSYHHQVDIFNEHAALSAFENNGQRDFDLSLLTGLTAAEYDALNPVQWPVTESAPQGTARMFEHGRFYTANGRAKMIAITPRLPIQQPDTEHPYIVNTGRIRDQWHTMTRTGLAGKLFRHSAEPYIDINPQDAAKLQLCPDQIVELTNTQGSYRGRAKLNPSQKTGQFFVPMHWNQQYSSHGRIDVLSHSVTDPISGQPELKHLAVDITPMPIIWQARLYSRNALSSRLLNEMPIDYWAKVPLQHCYEYRLASIQLAPHWLSWLSAHLQTPDYWFSDDSECLFRAASTLDNQLQWLLIVMPDSQQPEAGWLDSQFEGDISPQIVARELLAATQTNQVAKGPIVCSCFDVGMLQIEQAIEEGDTTPAMLTKKLGCGGNCGSCLPEINRLVSEQVHEN